MLAVPLHAPHASNIPTWPIHFHSLQASRATQRCGHHVRVLTPKTLQGGFKTGSRRPGTGCHGPQGPGLPASCHGPQGPGLPASCHGPQGPGLPIGCHGPLPRPLALPLSAHAGFETDFNKPAIETPGRIPHRLRKTAAIMNRNPKGARGKLRLKIVSAARSRSPWKASSGRPARRRRSLGTFPNRSRAWSCIPPRTRRR